MNSIYQKNIKIERGCEISPTTPVGTLWLQHAVVGVVEVVDAAEAENEPVDLDVIFRASAFLASLRLYHLVPRHRLSTVATRPVGLLAEDSWIGLAPFLADVFPLRPVVKAHAVTTLTVGTLLACKVAMVHSNPPFWPPIFLGVIYYNTRNSEKVKPKQKTGISAVSYLKTLKVINSWIKNFSFLLSPKTWFEPIVFPGSLAVLKSCGEVSPNFRGFFRRNAFGLIQEYCTIEEIASFEGLPRFARRLIRIGFPGQKRIGDFERRKEEFLILNPKIL